MRMETAHDATCEETVRHSKNCTGQRLRFGAHPWIVWAVLCSAKASRTAISLKRTDRSTALASRDDDFLKSRRLIISC